MSQPSTISLLLRNFFFTILQPGVVAGLVPYLIVGKKTFALIKDPADWYHYLGIVLFIPGLIILLLCVLRFAFEGKGTLSPADPTKHLVAKGLYKYSRNPMYVGVMLMLLGECIYFRSVPLLIYASAIYLLFYLFIIYYEEPRLRRDFGEAYTRYCNNVRRWI